MDLVVSPPKVRCVFFKHRLISARSSQRWYLLTSRLQCHLASTYCGWI